jgi:hypothetical protein
MEKQAYLHKQYCAREECNVLDETSILRGAKIVKLPLHISFKRIVFFLTFLLRCKLNVENIFLPSNAHAIVTIAL